MFNRLQAIVNNPCRSMCVRRCIRVPGSFCSGYALYRRKHNSIGASFYDIVTHIYFISRLPVQLNVTVFPLTAEMQQGLRQCLAGVQRNAFTVGTGATTHGAGDRYGICSNIRSRNRVQRKGISGADTAGGALPGIIEERTGRKAERGGASNAGTAGSGYIGYYQRVDGNAA